MMDTNKISSLICFDGMIDAAMQLICSFWLKFLFLILTGHCCYFLPTMNQPDNSLCAITPRLANKFRGGLNMKVRRYGERCTMFLFLLVFDRSFAEFYSAHAHGPHEHNDPHTSTKEIHRTYVLN